MISETSYELDDLDWEIIRELRKNPRINYVKMADKLGKNRNTIANRLGRLLPEDENGDPERNLLLPLLIPNYGLLKAISGYILATSLPGANQKETARKISEQPGVEEVSVITGEWDFIIKIRAKSMEQIGNVIIENLRKESGIASTITCISFWTFYGKDPFKFVAAERVKGIQPETS
ncbi:MAG TPA: Lrp/AsnC family transcriptional regulator [Candidatus Hodarchaeales archaeon]|nr:Lrp/AsnC family transcriptional regulator [Candidatus Hodarchaeales archaeon]